MKSSLRRERTVDSHVVVPKRAPLPELSIFPAFTPNPIHLADQADSSAYLSPVLTIRADVQELFASIATDKPLKLRGLTLDAAAEKLDFDDKVDAIHCVDIRRRTLLHQACRYGNVQTAECLLLHGANASAQSQDGRTPFHDAVSSSTGKSALELLKLLFEHDPAGISIVDTNGLHVLHLAAADGNLDVIQWCAALLVQSTEMTSASTSLGSAPSQYMMRLGITSTSGRNMLHYAAYNGRWDVLKWLLGSDNPRCSELVLTALDVNEYSVLHYAAMGAPLEVCEWLVLEAPTRHKLSVMARTADGKTALELASARPSSIRHFLTEASKVPNIPSNLRCLGADTASVGVGWDAESTVKDTKLWKLLKPLYFELEICKKPASLPRASGFLTMLMLMPPTSPGSSKALPAVSTALMSVSHLLHWESLGVFLQPNAREHWLCGLEKDTEYLIRMRARNRNGFSGYSLPNRAGVFSTSDGGRRRSLSSLQRFFGSIKNAPPIDAIASSFIGDLHFELLEARGLPRTYSGSLVTPCHVNTDEKACQGYYAVVTIETPSIPDSKCNGSSGCTRVIYCVRSPLATVQQDLMLSGSSQVWRHPRFAFSYVFRTPESLAHTQVTIAVHDETQGQSDCCCVGRLSLPLLSLVQGMPAKIQWLPLNSAGDVDTNCGLVLLRTLFLPNGVVKLPHPTLPNVWGTTAKELLSTTQVVTSRKSDGSCSPPSSSSSTASTESTSLCSSQFLQPSMVVDRLGFRVFDPEMHVRNGEWHQIVLPLGATRSYTYYKLLIESVEKQQEKQWNKLRCSAHVASTNQSCHTCNLTGIRDALSGTCDDSPRIEGFTPCIFHGAQKRAVRELIWQGIPMLRRPKVYLQISGASAMQTRYPQDYFLSLTKRLDDSMDDAQCMPKTSRFTTAKKQIQVDLKRTFGGHDECWLTSQMGQKSLERVLLAYALHNDALGYCQSMTFIVGRLLCLYHKMHESAHCTFEDEEQVFWLLCVITEDFFPSYYTQGMIGLQTDGVILEMLIRKRLPNMHRHFQHLHAPPMGLVLVTQWLLPLCCAIFPSETTFRFLDVLFFEGSAVVFAFAIALLRLSQHELVAENIDYAQFFRVLRARDQRLHDAPLLMEVAYEEHQLLGAQIDLLRQNATLELRIDRHDDDALRVTTELISPSVRSGNVDICT